MVSWLSMERKAEHPHRCCRGSATQEGRGCIGEGKTRRTLVRRRMCSSFWPMGDHSRRSRAAQGAPDGRPPWNRAMITAEPLNYAGTWLCADAFPQRASQREKAGMGQQSSPHTLYRGVLPRHAAGFTALLVILFHSNDHHTRAWSSRSSSAARPVPEPNDPVPSLFSFTLFSTRACSGCVAPGIHFQGSPSTALLLTLRLREQSTYRVAATGGR